MVPMWTFSIRRFCHLYKRLLLVGAGHAHLEVLRQWKENPLPNVQVCLISPNRYQYYSGMFSGFTEGIYEEEETRVDLRRLTIDACVHRIQKKAARIDVRHKKIICEDGSAYPFDVVSFDIGSGSLPLILQSRLRARSSRMTNSLNK